ncbi:MAG TPA: LemA family protein [Burkholderiaceae bacterium]|jgi:LemA protein|nr:LemA family protein [Burkholderiaceae bacterium]
MGLIVFFALIAAVAFWGMAIYNRLVAQRNEFKNAFAQIDVQLKRRYDLIPNLVETAKKYIAHERETLEAVVKARNSAVSANTAAAGDPANPEAMRQLAAAEGGLSGALGRLFAVAEAYPDLKANQNMMQLTEELTSTENRIAFARQAFNDAVMTYNNAVQQFPSNFIAGAFSFQAAELLKATESDEERKAVKVQF